MYNNKTVIISCAGMGKRLGYGLPKALVEVDGKPLIIRILELLDNCKDVRIVVGYKAELIIDAVSKYRKDILYVFNHGYSTNGTGASVSLASKFANEYIITIDGDLIVHPDDISKILEYNGEFVGVCDKSTDNPVLTIIKNNKVTAFSREKGTYEWTGVSQIKRNKINNCQGHVYQMIEPYLPSDYLKIRVKEIDTENDFKNAEKWVKNNYSNNIVLGIVGGMGSIATSHFFDTLVKSFKVKKEWERPRIIIDNRCNMPSRVRAALYNERREELCYSLEKSIKMMLDNDCDYIILACNTSHIFVDEIIKNIPELKGKILNIIELCVNKIHNDGIKKIRLLASEGTIDTKIYEKALRSSIKVDKLNKNDYEIFREWIEAVKQDKITDEVLDSFVSYINEVSTDTVILGCTELPILYEKVENRIKKRVYDPLQIVINKVVELNNKMN